MRNDRRERTESLYRHVKNLNWRLCFESRWSTENYNLKPNEIFAVSVRHGVMSIAVSDSFLNEEEDFFL